MKKELLPEAFHPGEYIREELEERGWAQLDLSAILGRPANIVNDIISGRRPITPEVAKALGDAFGTSALLWLNLQTAYQLAKSSPADDAVARRAKLYKKAPLREMQRRGWIEESSSIEVLETRVCEFLEIESIDEEVRCNHAARKSTDYGESNPAQIAWLKRAKKLAKTIPVERLYTAKGFDSLMDELSTLRARAEDVSAIPSLLARYGIRFLVLEPLPKTKIDGACFWLDENSPVIVLSLRYDRIDWFWHSIIHELGHVTHRDGTERPILETSMFGDEAVCASEKPVAETRADRFAVEFLVDQAELDEFVARNAPTFSKTNLVGFARRIGVHPGVVVGQLQHESRQEIPYSHFRGFLVRVRQLLIDSALTDGWSRTVAV